MFLRILFLTIILHATEIYTEMLLISNAIKQFPEYSPAIHYDNETYLNNFHYIYEHNLRNVSIYLVNHDLNDRISMPKDRKFLHIVLLDNSSYLEKYIFMGKNFSCRDLVLTIFKTKITKSQLTEACTKKDLYRASGVFLFETFNTTLYCCWYYYGRKYVYLRKIGMTTGKVPQLREYLNKFTNFAGYSFKIGYSEYEPFFYCHFSDENNKCRARGPESHLLKTLSNLLNFRYELFEFNGESDKGAWEVMLIAVYSGKMDWAVSGISQSLFRSRYLDYTRYFHFECYKTLFVAYESQWLTTRHYLHTIGSNWISDIALVLSVIGIALLTKISLKIHKIHSDSTATYIRMMLAYLVEQHSTTLENRIRHWKPYIKALFVFWWFMCFTQIIYYKAVQTYYLISLPIAPNQLEDLLKEGFQFEVHIEDYPNIKHNCRNATSMVCKKILKTINVTANQCNSIANVLNNKVAFIEEGTPLQYLVVKKCNVTLHQKMSVKLITANILTNQWHAWATEKDKPFMRSFSRIISRLEASGIISYWYKKELNFLHHRARNNPLLRKKKNSLNLYNISSAFVILLTGYSISTAVYLIEVSLFKSKVIRSSKRNNLK